MGNHSSVVRQRVSDVISQWRRNHAPDARRFLSEHPEVKSAPSLVIDLAYEEFCLREASGEQVDTEKFCDRFPTIQYSLARALEMHRALSPDSIKAITWPEAGTAWLDWELVEPLGRGAFSRVFVAREPALGNREIALKCSLAGPDEAFILGSLAHANIVPVHSVRHDATSGLTAISMPLLGRKTLGDVLDRLVAEGDSIRSPELFGAIASDRPLVVRSAAQSAFVGYAIATAALIQRVATGLAAAHRTRVIHGDIKPSNILLTFKGEPMLMDFNLSGGPLGDASRQGGTPPYMAPECLAGFLPPESQAGVRTCFDPRSDVFSLGVVLLELLLGRIPFKFDFNDPASLPCEQEWLQLISQPNAAGRLIPSQLQAVLRRCLAYEPALRYAQADELSGDLQEIVTAHAKRGRLTRRLAIAAGITTVASGSGVLLWNHFSLLNRARRHIARHEFLPAVNLLAEVQENRNDLSITAWIAYCYARGRQYQQAISLLKVVAKEFSSAALWNDLGFCSARLGLFSAAEEQFRQALSCDSKLGAAYHNRALMRLQKSTKQSLPLSPATWSDFKQALDCSPPNAQLHHDAAYALAYSRLREQLLSGDLEQQVMLALAGGVSPHTFTEHPFVFTSAQVTDLSSQASKFVSPPRSKSATLLLPPPFPLPAT